MKAMIFAAGKGTRLKPLTDDTPKALIRVQGIALLEHVVRHLKSYGVTEIIINVHYLAAQVIQYLKEKNYFNILIHISDETHLLLDTGGGLKKASVFFEENEDFFAYNVDILSDIDLNEFMKYHKTEGNLASLAVRSRDTNRYFLFDDVGQLCGWENTKDNQKIISRETNDILKPLAFSGIHIINSRIFKLMTEEGVFSITQEYLKLAKYSRIKGYLHQNSQWYDIGKIDSLNDAERNLKKNY